jgi:dipeptidyl-peptidase-4
MNTPPVVTVRSNSGKVLKTIIDNKKLSKKLSAYDISMKEKFHFTTSEGVMLNGWMIKPVNFDASKRYPVIMYQYGGPGAQQVLDKWSIGAMGQGGIYEEYLAQKGFVVVCVDGRGTGGRGADFEKCTYLRLGEKEAKDQVETALYVGSLPYVDKSRIGIWGWSYGGWNTL